MTDLVTRPDADSASFDDAATAPLEGVDAVDGDASYEWAPPEKAPAKRRWWLWIGIPAALVTIALVVSSLLLIAPGTAVAGVNVGGMTQGAAVDAISARLATTTVELTGAGGDVTLTAAELGAGVNAEQLASEAFAAYPAWKIADWFAAPSVAEVTIDEAAATETLRARAAELFAEPVNAAIGFDAASAAYVVTPAVAGKGVDLEAIRAGLQTAFAAADTSVSMTPVAVPVDAAGTTAAAQESVDGLNGMLDTVGFYVGDERTVPVDRAVAASWMTVSTADDGTIAVDADPAGIQTMIDTLPDAINRAPVNATVITDTGGGVLSTPTPGVDGRAVGDTSGAADTFAGQLSGQDGIFQVPMEATPFTTAALARNIVVNLSQQRTYLIENGQVVNSFLISSGNAGTPTHTGSFRMNAHVRIQNMGCFEGAEYCTEDVPWVSYFNGDQGFHGTYWHNNFGQTMSHGCVNMTINDANYVYNWAPIGTQVTVEN